MRSVILLLAALAAAPRAHATVLAEVSPTRLDVTVASGGTVTREVAFSNRGDSPIVLRLRYSDWTVDEHGRLGLGASDDAATSLAGLVTFDPAELRIEPGATAPVKVTLMLPADGPATRWGMLLSEVRLAMLPTGTSATRAVAELGTRLYLSHVPAEDARTEIVEMKTSPRAHGTAELAIRVRNAGSRHSLLAGEIALVDSTGERVRVELLPTGIVLPGGSRRYTWMLADLPPGRYLAVARLDTGESGLRVGEIGLRWPLRPPTGAALQSDPLP